MTLRKDTTSTQVLQFIKENPGCTRKNVQCGLGLSESQTNNAVTYLRKKGHLVTFRALAGSGLHGLISNYYAKEAAPKNLKHRIKCEIGVGRRRSDDSISEELAAMIADKATRIVMQRIKRALDISR